MKYGNPGYSSKKEKVPCISNLVIPVQTSFNLGKVSHIRKVINRRPQQSSLQSTEVYPP
jgi:hypothetical protein